MSAQEEPGSEAKWFGDDYERNGLFGNAPTRFDGRREAGEDQQYHLFQDEGKRPPVAMETASTGKNQVVAVKTRRLSATAFYFQSTSQVLIRSSDPSA